MISGEEANKIRTGLSAMLDTACTHISQVGRAVKRLDNLKIVLYMKRDNAKAAIQGCIKKLQDQLLELQKVAETNLNLEVHAREDILRATKVKLMQHIRDTAGECTEIEELLEAGKEDKLATTGQSVLQVMEGLVQYNADEAIVGLAHLEFIPNTTSLMAALQNPSLFGYLQCTVVSPSDVSVRLSGHEQIPRCITEGESQTLILETGDTHIINLTQYFKLMLFQPDRTIEELTVEDVKDGSYRAKFHPKMLGTHVLHIKLYGNPVIGSPISFLVVETPETAESAPSPSKAKVRVCRSTLTAVSRHIGSNPPVKNGLFGMLEGSCQLLENTDEPLIPVPDKKGSYNSKPGGTKRKFLEEVDTKGTSNEEAHSQMTVTRQEFNDLAPEPRPRVGSFSGPMKDVAKKFDMTKVKGNSTYGSGKANASSSGKTFSRSDSVDNWRKPSKPTSGFSAGPDKNQAPGGQCSWETAGVSKPLLTKSLSLPGGTDIEQKQHVKDAAATNSTKSVPCPTTKSDPTLPESTSCLSEKSLKSYGSFLSENEFVCSQQSDRLSSSVSNQGMQAKLTPTDSSQKPSGDSSWRTSSTPKLSGSLSKSPPPGFLIKSSVSPDSASLSVPKSSSSFGSRRRSAPPGFGSKISTESTSESSLWSSYKPAGSSIKQPPPGFGLSASRPNTAGATDKNSSGAQRNYMPPPPTELRDTPTQGKQEAVSKPAILESSTTPARVTLHSGQKEEVWTLDDNNNSEPISKETHSMNNKNNNYESVTDKTEDTKGTGVGNTKSSKGGGFRNEKTSAKEVSTKEGGIGNTKSSKGGGFGNKETFAKEVSTKEGGIGNNKSSKGGGFGNKETFAKEVSTKEGGIGNTKSSKGGGFGKQDTSKEVSSKGIRNPKTTKGGGFGNIDSGVASTDSSQKENLFEKYLWDNKVLKMHMTLKLGKQGSGVKDFSFPIGVTVTQRNDLIVCDTGNEVVKVFHCTGTHLFTIGSEKKFFKRPSAVASNKDGIIFVKDDRQIQAFDKMGNFLYAFGQSVLSKPYGLAMTAEGHLLTLDESRKGKRLCLFSQSGELIREDPFEPATMDKRRSRCRFLAVFKDRVFVVDLGQSEVYITDLHGKSISSFGSFGDKLGQFREPSGVSVDIHGNVFIADSKNNRIQYFNLEGECKCVVKLDNDILRPSDIHVTDDGRLIVSNLLAHCVKLYSLQSAQ